MNAEPARVNMLLTGGCSFVWGDELDGCHDSPPSHHPKTFAALTAKKLGVKCKNIAAPGNGNTRIFRDIVDYLNTHDDVTHIVILWSYWGREEFGEALNEDEEKKFRLKRRHCMSQVSDVRVDSLKEPLRSKVDEMYWEEGWKKAQIMRGINYMTAMKVIAESRGIKLVQGIFNGIMWTDVVRVLSKKTDENYFEYKKYITNALNSLPNHHKLGLQNSYEDFHNFGKRRKYGICPEGHPTEKSHAEFAKLIYHIFESTDWTK